MIWKFLTLRRFSLVKCKAISAQAWTSPEGLWNLRLSDFKTIDTWRFQVCEPYAPAAFTTKKIFPVPISVRSWVEPGAIVQREGLRQWKIPVTPPAMDPATFHFVAQCATSFPAFYSILPNCFSFSSTVFSSSSSFFFRLLQGLL